MTDVLLSIAPDGGEIEVVNGEVSLTQGYSVAVELSLFGGNERDSGDEDGEPLQWWGNLGEPMPERRYRSRTQHLLRSLPAVPANLRRLEDAMESDTAWLVELGAASLIEASCSMPAPNRVAMKLRTIIDGVEQVFSFERHWSAQG